MQTFSLQNLVRHALAVGAISVALSLGACDSVKKSDGDDEPATGTVITTTARTDGTGRATTEFALPEGVTKFAITAQSSAPLIKFDAVEDSEGNSYINADDDFTSFSTTFLRTVNAVNIPSRSVDRAPTGGLTYSATVDTSRSALGSGIAGTTVNFVIDALADGGLSSGTLTLNAFLVGDVANDSSSANAINEALEVVREIYSDQANVNINVRQAGVAGPATLPSPIDGSSLYADASSTAPSPAVNVFFGEEIEDGDNFLGLASSIPGPPRPSVRSAVVVSLVNSAGPDGAFSSDDIRTLGETIAHESGHFLGLFHPVEINSVTGSVADVDPLGDTPTCSSLNDCLQNSSLISNLMFPFPVSSGDGTIPQNQLTGDQAGVMNRYAAVN